MRYLYMLVAGLLVVSGAQSAPTDARTELALRLMETTHFERTMNAMQGQMRTMMEQQLSSSVESCEAAAPVLKRFSGEVADKISGVLGSEDLKIDIAALYAEVFSEDELREVIEFYKSPLGAKLLDRMPELMQKSMQVSQQRMQTVIPEISKLGQQYGSEIASACKSEDMPAAQGKKH